MKNHILTLIFLKVSFASLAQKQTPELDNWIKTNNIEFNNPNAPNGFEHFLNCDKIHAYRKTIGDTIIIYSRGSSIAENIEQLKKSIKKREFNVYRYPAYKQSNGTIVMQNLRKWTFLRRNDSLYLLDTNNDKKIKSHTQISMDFMTKKINKEEFLKKVAENDKKDFGFQPKFKLIYWNGIFDQTNQHTFNKKENFRQEKVQLIKQWVKNDQIFYKIKLETNTAGDYTFSEDFSFINTEICEK
ncbi:hypothetical protein KFZ70_15040 [Tamlana fucoidanivorans]|uniref:Uncharacterized protein n=1 Tax=Allotamlana fucoidanivorans TaxID=2583814 RepID=A0A5C4SCA4_9FLAO|nr:hypothetical protein [Tamlana fucoidanivorans]TNJ40922.1 hypothetical protein FGF67_16645 [Tamlana fucoidanivorans]